MKVLVVGRSGQVASSLKERIRNEGLETFFAGRPELDLELLDTIKPIVRDAAPDVVVNAAAWTAVDGAEDEADRAMTVNAAGPDELAKVCKNVDARLIHLSTDYVFDGRKEEPYIEDDPVNPQSVYGQSKLEGENCIRRQLPDHHVILRTAWVYSSYGRNFMKTMLSLAETRDDLKVVDDQFGSPTSALDIADAIAAILTSWKEGPEKGLGHTYNCAGSGEATWAEFAKYIFETSAKKGGPSAQVEGIPSSQFPSKVIRPSNSRLDCSKLQREFGITMPHWKISAAATLDSLLVS